MSDTIIETTITTAAPLSITMPVVQNGRANEWNNFPVCARGVDDAGQPRWTGYLPATTVRGFLRREVALAAMRARGVGKTTLQQAYADVLGQGDDTKEEVDLQKLQALRETEPILDLFGSWSVKSRLLVSNFMPMVNVLPTPFTGVRKDLGDTDGVLDMLDPAQRDAYYQRSEVNSERSSIEAQAQRMQREINKARKDGRPTTDLEAAKAAIDAKVAALRESLGAMQNSSRMLHDHYALPGGLDLHGRIVIQQPKPRDLPMLEQALERLSLRPLLGAQVARGCGEIAATFRVMQGGAVLKTITVGGWAPAVVTDFAVVSA